MTTDFSGRFLGVLGGMGPLAGTYFVQRLIALTPATRDQEHVPTILWSDPRIPERPAGFERRGEDPLPWLINGVSQLTRCGAGAIAIPCNTAHLWHEQMSAATNIPVLHIVGSVCEELQRRHLQNASIGLMATAATTRAGMYQRIMARDGLRCLVSQTPEFERLCAQAIDLVKRNQADAAFDAAAKCVEMLADLGADVVVLGCTELPLALPYARRTSLRLPVIDSIDTLASSALRWWRQSDPHDAPFAPLHTASKPGV
ncbi:aspartate/glutamate racemase family protein [Pandoraea anhela]|uniref:Aspartate racemase n=1 Tax=Pandoraea anhela TaxID=2508295 RepID=A0A5E4WC38_9BURK|nr:amino acid racemase [Pandoraea anhela]VVE21234.1 Aspartate racemase [Pandoraea anhela]